MKNVGFWVAVLLVSICASIPYVQASQCQSYFQPGRIVFRGYFKSEEHGKYFIKIEKPKTALRQWVVLVHGLLDSSRGWNDLTPLLLEQGYGVVRLDLKGHGRTLYQDYKSSMEQSGSFEVPYQIPLEQNVQLVLDALRTLQKHGVEKPILVGHSMGGAVVLSLSRHQEAQNLIAPKVVLVSPYVYRLDRRAMETAFSGYFWGFSGWGAFFDLMPGFYREFIERWITDFFADPLMYRQFEDFARSKILEADAEVSPEHLKEVMRYQIKSAMAITKGLRDFDGVELAQQIASSNEFIILMGKNDELMDVNLERKLAQALNAELAIEESAGHMIINQKPQFVLDEILSFLKK